jgi:predicted thioesterase
VQLHPGVEAEAVLVVSEGDTAVAVRSGDVPVLATPRLIALCEEATVAAVSPYLEPGETSVGADIVFEHLAASPIGAEVTAHAVLSEIDRRTLTFVVTASQGDRVVGRGSVTRVVLDRERFLSGLDG